MGLSFWDPSTEELREFRPASPPAVGVEAIGKGLREKAVALALERALRYLGLEPAAGGELSVGGAQAREGARWLKVAPLTGEDVDAKALKARGYEPADFEYLCLRTHYRKPLAFSWAALEEARRERLGLLDSLRSLQDSGLEPSPRGFSGYSQRFRNDLERDLDLPGAVFCVWDALRPGALSPGSKAALLRQCLPVLGL